MTPRGDGVNSEIEETSEEIGFLRESIASFIDRVQSVSRPQGPAADSGKQAPQPMPSCPVCEKIVALRNSIANLNYMLAEASNRIAL